MDADFAADEAEVDVKVDAAVDGAVVGDEVVLLLLRLLSLLLVDVSVLLRVLLVNAASLCVAMTIACTRGQGNSGTAPSTDESSVFTAEVSVLTGESAKASRAAAALPVVKLVVEPVARRRATYNLASLSAALAITCACIASGSAVRMCACRTGTTSTRDMSHDGGVVVIEEGLIEEGLCCWS